MIDSGQFERFYSDTLSNLEKFAVRLTRSHAAAEDLVQETYYRFLRSQFEGGSDEERRRYLYRIAVNIARNQWSRRRDETPVEIPITHHEPSDAIDVKRALSQMSERDRALLWLAYAEGYSHREIAGVMSVSALSVRVLLFRARKRFVEMMQR